MELQQQTNKQGHELYFEHLADEVEKHFYAHAYQDWNRNISQLEYIIFGDVDSEFVFEDGLLYVETTADISMSKSWHGGDIEVKAKVKTTNLDVESIADEINFIFDNEISKYYVYSNEPDEFKEYYER